MVEGAVARSPPHLPPDRGPPAVQTPSPTAGRPGAPPRAHEGPVSGRTFPFAGEGGKVRSRRNLAVDRRVGEGPLATLLGRSRVRPASAASGPGTAVLCATDEARDPERAPRGERWLEHGEFEAMVDQNCRSGGRTTREQVRMRAMPLQCEPKYLQRVLAVAAGIGVNVTAPPRPASCHLIDGVFARVVSAVGHCRVRSSRAGAAG